MQEKLPTVSLSLRNFDTSKIQKLLGSATSSEPPNIHALLDNHKTTEAEKLFVKRTKPGKNQIELRIPTSVELAKLRFSAHMGKKHIHVQTVDLVCLDKEDDVLQPQRGEMIIPCHIDFSGTKTSGLMTVLEELLLNAEKQRSKELESRTGWYSDEFLPKVVKEAKKQSFKFTSQSSMLMDGGIVQFTLSTETVETHGPTIANCQKNRGILEVVIRRKTVVGRISQWEPDNRTLFLKLDRYETLPSELFQDIPVALNITYDACGDLRILLSALGRLKHGKAQMESFPLDLFLFGEDEDILDQARPLGEKDIIEPISHYLRNDLNEEQKKAIELALATPDFFLLQGPPGTGKTTFIAELCYQFIQRGKKVLIASQSNAAVDNAIARLVMHPDILAVRLGKEGKLTAMSENFVKQKAVLRWLQSTVQASRKALQALKNYSSIFHNIPCDEWEQWLVSWECRTLSARIQILEEWTTTIDQNLAGVDVSITEQIWKRFLQHVNVCGVTCAYAGIEGFLNTFSNFDVTIIDEVSKAAITELVAPCMLGKKIILVGDHKQLPPTITQEMEQSIEIVAQDDADGNKEIAKYNETKVKEWLTSKVFEKRFEFFAHYAPDYQRTVMLTKQYRMHSEIMTAINQFYNGLLTQGCADQERQHHLSRKWWLQNEEAHLVWIDTAECKEWKHKQDGPSRMNPQEARLIINILRDILEDLAGLPAQQESLEIGVISVYRAQANLIERMFILERQQNEHFSNIAAHIHVRFGTVDEFQGVEKDIILLSLVLNSHKNDMTSFLEDPKRINVAMSRAKRLLLIIGSKYNYTETDNEACEFYRHIYSTADQVNATLFKEKEESYHESVPDSDHVQAAVAPSISIGQESISSEKRAISFYTLLEGFIIRCLLEIAPCKTRQIEELLCLQKIPLVELFMEQLKKEGYIRKTVSKNWIVEDQERLRERYEQCKSHE
jgi:GTPase SAR1 family protein